MSKRIWMSVMVGGDVLILILFTLMLSAIKKEILDLNPIIMGLLVFIGILVASFITYYSLKKMGIEEIPTKR